MILRYNGFKTRDNWTGFNFIIQFKDISTEYTLGLRHCEIDFNKVKGKTKTYVLDDKLTREQRIEILKAKKPFQKISNYDVDYLKVWVKNQN